MNLIDPSYKHWLESIKHKIKAAQLKAAVSVSSQMLEMYWQLAEEIVSKQKNANWGEAVLEQLSVDLKLSFPNINGFSRRNLYAMRQRYLFYSTQHVFVPQLVAQIPWGHNRLIISKIKNIEEALFYCIATLENVRNRDHLALAIKNKYYETKGKFIGNLKRKKMKDVGLMLLAV